MSAAEHLEQARTHLSAGESDQAMAAIRLALAEEPENLDAMLFAARLVRQGGNPQAAESLYSKIIEHHPESAAALAGLGACFGMSRRYERAVVLLRQAVTLKPDYFEAWSFLGEALIEQGRTEEAMDCFERSLTILPHNGAALSKQLFYSVFDPRYDAKRVATLNRDWGTLVGGKIQRLPPPFVKAADGRIRIGYLSDEFYERVTTRFLTPVFAHHDRTRFHVTGYARNARQDETTETLRGHTDAWRDIAGLDDAEAAARIRADDIDILVICTSYRVEARTVLAYKPAPIQLCYSNLVSTTGLEAVDYLVTEESTDPVGCDDLYTEALVRISNRNIYMPPHGAPDPGPLPCLENGAVRFASFNNLGKLSPAVIGAWSRILKALPASKLTLKSVNRLQDSGARDYFSGLFGSHGIDQEQLEFLSGDADLRAHLERYRAVDIALDPFPCNGGTTSCEALWMGVPVVTMAGDTFMGRQGVNYLGKLGLEDLIAKNAESYVAAAVQLATDTPRLQQLRVDLRDTVTERLFDPQRHVIELETAYAEMWRRHGAGEEPGPFRVAGNRVLA